MRGGCIGVLFIYLWAVTLAQKTLSSLSGIIKDISKNQSHLLLSASLLKKEDELIALWDPGLRPCDSEDDKENVLESLSQNPRFIVTPISQKQHEECHHINARYSGTDLKGGILEEDNALNASDCQSRCKMNSKCKYFLFFSKNHHQRFKHGICRLLQYSGKLEKDLPGHISGPKACLSPEVKNQINYICLKLKELLSLEATYESSQKLSCSPSQLNKDIELLIPGIEQSVSYLFVEVILSRYCDTSEGSSEIQIVRDGKLLQKDYFENETASVLKDDSLLKSDNVNDIISTLTLDSQKKVESNTKSLVTSTDAATTQNQIQISTEPLEKDISSREQMKNSEISKGISEISTGPILSLKVERKLNDNDENPLDSGTTSKILDVKLEKAENAPLYDDYLYYDYYENDAIESSLTPENLDSTPPNVNLVDKETINPIIKETKATSNPSFPESKNQVTTTSGFINDFNLVPVTSTEATTKKIATTEPILKEKEINFNTVSSKISESEIEKSTIRSLLKEFNGFNLESVTKAEAPAKKFEMAKLIPRKAGINLNTVSFKTESDTERSTTQFLFKEFNGFNLESVTKAEDPTKKK
ncbi:uncharacterized protein [Lepeophtheirus salmonis]|uniref:uncharacterized protein n=1 Tax=Lepeophtheirus salmonis TaxID=72036 RepID=UPI001AE79B99|nr:uncharacterized protein LOC121114865 [Lepeophtheirus salmonis]